jgi:hypothetical protein
MSFENPIALEGGTMMTSLSQIDVRALELDPVVFEPLPSIHDLSPLATAVNLGCGGSGGPSSSRGHGGGDSSGSHHHQASNSYFQQNNHHVGGGLPNAVPFSTKDTQIYAHDWFGKLFNF